MLKNATLPYFRALVMLIKHFIQIDGAHIAASLTLTTLLTIVPGLTLLVALWSLGGQSEQSMIAIQLVFSEHLLPSSSSVALDFLNELVRQAQAISWVGLLMLIVSLVLLVIKVEATLRRIWQVGTPKWWPLHWLSFLTGFFILPALFALLVLFSLWITAFPLLSIGREGILTALPWMISFFSVTLLWLAVPGVRVNLSRAIKGALWFTLSLWLSKTLAWKLLTLLPSFQFLYGAFAFVPLLILWIWLNWGLLLIAGIWVARPQLKQAKKLKQTEQLAGVHHE